jgi:alanine racemase
MKFRSRLVVNLDHLKFNLQHIKKIAPSAQSIFMIKADGYGHGMVPLARYAFTELGITEFGCATLDEAKVLRSELPELSFDIYVFSDLQLISPESVETYSNQRIFPVVSSLSQLDFFLHQESFKFFPLCLKFNTGMNRLGLEVEKLDEILKRLELHNRKSIYHLFTHLANSSFSMIEDIHNVEQVAKFKILKEKFIQANIIIQRTSISNSGAILQNSGLDQTHIRPGIMLYTHPKCVSKLETTILHAFTAKKDQPIGYNSIPCIRDGVVAVLAIGYGDGFSTHYTGAHITHRGNIGEIIGRINMDMTFVLFPASAQKDIKVDDVVTIWGENEGDLLNFSNETKTITYQLLCSLLPRIPRNYRLS